MEIINGHYVYTDGDIDVPEAIKDRNGDVVLSCCMLCGRGEVELEERCALTTDALVKTDDMVAVPRGLLAALGYVVRRSAYKDSETHKKLKEFQFAPALTKSIGGGNGKDS